jgi:dipeptidyl aminopeptidase/acylaminoacyl peptidase
LLPYSVFAQQGYVVILINPTGSTSFGQALTDGIQRNWGGRPIQDLLAGLQHALKLYPEVDPERLAGLGASYGGYAINWIQGHNDVFGFKTLVCHDGIFSTSDVSETCSLVIL